MTRSRDLADLIGSSGLAITGDIVLEDNNPTITINDSSVVDLQHLIVSSSNNLILAADNNNVDAGTKIQFYVDGTEHMVINSSGYVGIGTSTPGQKLEIKESSTGAGDAIIRLRGDGNNANNTPLGSLEWFNTDSSGPQPGVVAAVEAQSANSNGHMGKLLFKTHDGSGSEADPPTTRMTIEESGNVLVGTTDNNPVNNGTDTSADDGVVLGASGSIAAARYNNTPMFANRTGDNGALIDFRYSGAPVGSIGIINSEDLYINATDDLALQAGGNTGIGIFQSGGTLQNVTVYADLLPSGTNDIGVSGAQWRNLYLSGTATMGGLGIGTTTPATALEISANNNGAASNNTLRFTDTDTATETNQQIGKIEFKSNDVSGDGALVRAYIFSGSEDASPSSYISFATNAGNSGNLTEERLRIDSQGDVGIGTNNPSAKLDVNDAGVTDNAWNTLAKFRPDLSDGSAETSIHIQSYPSTTVVADRKAGIQAIDDLGVARPLLLNKAGGNVGIGTGTTSPGQKLVVQGSNHIATLLNTSTATNAYSQLLLQAGSSTNYIWTQNQNSTNYGGAHSLNLYTQQAGPIAFFTGGNNERMRIDSSGNVGIGVVANTGWNSTYKAIQVGNAGAVWSEDASSSNTLISNNEVYDTNGNYYRLVDGPANDILLQNDGSFLFRSTATSEVAGAQILDQTTKMTIDSSGLATFAGDIATPGIQMGSGVANDIQADGKTAYIGSAIFGDSTASNTPSAPVHIKGAGAPALRIEDLDQTNQVYDFISNEGVGLSIVDQTAGITPLSFAHTTGNATFGTQLELNSNNIIDSGNITLANAKTIQLYTTNGDIGTGSMHLPRAGQITFYGNGNNDHSIASRSSAGVTSDDIRISSYGSIIFDLDSNANNTSNANFIIGRHGGGTNQIGTLLTVSGENGVITHSNFELNTYSNGTVPITLGKLRLIVGSKTGWDVGDELGSIEFYSSDASGVGARNAARIAVVNNFGNGTSTTTFGGDLSFYTSAYNTAINSTAALTLDGSNNATFAGTISSGAITAASYEFNSNSIFYGKIGVASGPSFFYTGTNTPGSFWDINNLSNGNLIMTLSDAGAMSIAGTLTQSASDERLKENIQPITNALEKLNLLRGVEFDWKDNIEGFSPEQKHETGVIAQEVEKVMPDAVVPAPFNKEYKTVHKDKLIALLIEAVKELQQEVELLKNNS